MRGTEFLNLWKKYTRRSPTLILEGWLPKTLTLEKCYLNFCFHWFTSSLRKHLPHGYTVQSSPLDWMRVNIVILEPGKFKLRRLWVIQGTLSPTTRKMPQTQTFSLSIQSSFQTACYWRLKQTLLWAWHRLLLWGLIFFFFISRLRVVHLQKLIMYVIIKVWATLVASS